MSWENFNKNKKVAITGGLGFLENNFVSNGFIGERDGGNLFTLSL